MFLHLVDDEKFIPDAIDLFNRCDPGNHEFVLIKRENQATLRYLQCAKKVKVVQRASEDYYVLSGNLSNYAAVFIHGLFNPAYIEMVNAASAKTVFVWIFWGGELLSIPRFRNQMLLPRTRLLYYKNRVVPWLQRNAKKYISLLSSSRTQYTYFQKKTPVSRGMHLGIEQAIKRVDYIVPVFEDDYYDLQKMIPCRAKQIAWNYPYPLPIKEIKERQFTSNNWLVGNSAHYSNNHLEMFERLKKIKGHSGRIIVPLSYGDSQYQMDIMRLGRQILKDQFVPLNEFLVYQAYLDILCSCSAAFFNTRRQQAMGNIGLLLNFGAKIYLREENPAYRFLKRKGAIVFSIQADIPHNAAAIDTPLDDKSVRKNRTVLMQIASDAALQEKTEVMLAILKEKGDPGKSQGLLHPQTNL